MTADSAFEGAVMEGARPADASLGGSHDISDHDLRARIALSDERARLIAEQERAALAALERHRANERRAELGEQGPRVSIIMPVFNGGRYFELALKSALAQTYENLEIVIVNDGSDDGGATESIGRRYAAEHPARVRYLQQQNTGVSGALNLGVRAMSGDIFCWLSHDDLFKPEKTAIQADVWRRIGRPDTMLISDYGVIGPEGEVRAAGSFSHAIYAAAPRLPIYRGGVNGCTVFIPVHLLRSRPEPFDVSLRFAGDYKLWLELLRERDFIHVPEQLVYSRHHPGQDSRRPDVAGEGEALWRTMVDELSEVQRSQLYGSSWRFFDETHQILAKSPYKNVAAHMAARRDSCLKETPVSVILTVDNEANWRESLDSVLAQTHPRLDVLVVDRASRLSAETLSAATGSDTRVRLFQEPGPSGPVRNLPLRRVQGAYVALLSDRAVWPPEKISTQLQAMLERGAMVSHTSFAPGSEGELAAGSPARAETVMLHRSLIAAGLQLPEEQSEQLHIWEELSQRHASLVLEAVLCSFIGSGENADQSRRSSNA